jgi:hypothetical protein
VSKRDRLLQRLLTQPKGWSFADLRKVAKSVGIEIIEAKGDHWKFRAPGHHPVIVDPGKGGHEVLIPYVCDVRNLVQAILDEREQEQADAPDPAGQEGPDERGEDD